MKITNFSKPMILKTDQIVIGEKRVGEDFLFVKSKK